VLRTSAAQLEGFLSIEDKTDPQIGLAVTRNAVRKELMSYSALRRFVALFNERMKP
jgi:hypothetical protein